MTSTTDLCPKCEKPHDGCGVTLGDGRLMHPECYRLQYPERFVCQCAEEASYGCQVHGSNGVIDYLRSYVQDLATALHRACAQREKARDELFLARQNHTSHDGS